ncbi:MAG: NPCBM/NEW2 domain-containing protein [Verrucomicrobiota bacterium]
MNLRLHRSLSSAICTSLGAIFAVMAALPSQALGQPAELRQLTLQLQTRDPVTGAPSSRAEVVDPRKVGVVVVDMWNWHWCKTSTMRVAALVPRMNRVLNAARKVGMQVFLCPTDVADNYVGTPMVESLVATPLLPVPQARVIECPAAPDGGGCTCGAERCQSNYGWDGMHPDLQIGESDLMPNDQQMLYSLCRARGITHLIFMGVHTQVCLLGKSIGLRAMSQAGLNCVLARDLTDAHGKYDLSTQTTPDSFTETVVAHFEKHLAPTVNMVETLEQNGLWESGVRIDPVRVAPWGTLMRPHLFEKEITVTLSAPWQKDAVICYTLDGSAPTPDSLRYRAPFPIRDTTRLRAMAFRDGKPATLGSEAYFAHLDSKPPLPDIFLSELKPLRAVGPGHSPSFNDHRFSPGSNPPQLDQTNRKQPLRLRGQRYQKGLGMQAPSQVVYELMPGYDRFVASAGVDEYIVDVNNASNLGMHPSVVFKVFIDGRQAAASPVMRLLEEPWRFNVPIPPGSRRLSLVATDAGDGNREDLANWVNAGFVTKPGAAPH